MKEHKAIGPNLKTYYYYTNELAEKKDVKGIVVIATGIEGTGAVYDEVGEYLGSKGYAVYAIDEWGYGKTGKVVAKTSYKNWKSKDFHFASYSLHALSTTAKANHPGAPVYLIGNDFGAMLSLYLIREFPEVIDKIVTIGWGTPRWQDLGFLCSTFIKKFFFFDDNASKSGHRAKNRRLSLAFEKKEKYAWLSSDLTQVKKIKDAGFIDEPGTVGHYFYYYKKKIKTPMFMRFKDSDRNTPILFMSGNQDLTTLKGKTTRKLAKYYKFRKFINAESLIVDGRHELLFEVNRKEIMDTIISWLEGNKVEETSVIVKENQNNNNVEDVEVVGEKNIENNANKKEEIVEDVIDVSVEETPKEVNVFQEAEDDLLIRTEKKGE